MGAHMPKQFLRIAGREVVDYALEQFQNNSMINEILVMSHPDFVDLMQAVAKKYSKVVAVLPGGKTRNETSLLALEYINEESKVLLHDAVRPFVSDRIISDCINALDKYSAVDVAIPSADTVIKINDSHIIEDIPLRAYLRRGQTPQAFKWSIVKKAYDLAAKHGDLAATDDCGVVKKYLPDEKILVVDGDENNIKITHPLDLSIADKLFQLKSIKSTKYSKGFRKEQMGGKTVVIFGGSHGIGAEIKKIAESLGTKCYSFSRSETGTDITKENSVKKALESVAKEGNIDFVVNTAGRLEIKPLAETDSKTIREMIDVNFTSVAVIASVAKPFLSKTKGQLLLFTSSSYTRGRENYSLYSASKAAIVNMTQALSEEWNGDVRINCINPARTATPMRTKAFGKEDPSTLLKAKQVAEVAIDTLISNFTGQVVDVKQS